jgi:phosphinothricin acetyltransferase
MASRIRDAHEWLVSERDGVVVGYAYGGVHRTRAAYNRTVEVSAYVDRSAQRSGVGRELYEELFRRLKERGFRLLVAGVTMPNAASIGLHESLGFERVGVFHDIGFKSGRWWDVGWWELDLGQPGSKPPE